MREEIFKMLPGSLPKELMVVIACSENRQNGIPGIRRRLQEIDPGRNWTQLIVKRQIPKSGIPSKLAAVLPVNGISHASHLNLQVAADKAHAFCPAKVLTPKETEEMLTRLAHIRNGIVEPPIASPAEASSSEADRLAQLATIARQSSRRFTEIVNQPGAELSEFYAGTATETDSPENPDSAEAAGQNPETEEPVDDIAAANQAISKFRELSIGICEVAHSAEAALLFIEEKLNATNAERDELQEELIRRDARIAELEAQIEADRQITEHRDRLLAENKSLVERLATLEAALCGVAVALEKARSQTAQK